MAHNDQKSCQPPTAPSPWQPVTRQTRHRGPEMSGNVRRIENFDLPHRQQAVLPVMASAPSLAQAARISGFAERTLRRWLDDDDFRGELTRLRQESAELARLELQGLMFRSVSVLSQAMDDPDQAIRLRAARYVMSFAVRVCETGKLKKDIQDLEDAVALCNAQHPVKYRPRQVPTPRQVNEVIALCLPSEPASAPSNEPWPWNLPSSGSAGWPGSSASNRRWSAPAVNRRPSPMPLSNRWSPPASGSHPSWRSINTSRGAGSKTSSPTAKTSLAPSSPGPGAIPLPPSGRDENNCPILACDGPVWDPQG